MTYYVYVVYDRDRRPLYVGQTNNLRRRMREHELKSAWMAAAGVISVLPFGSRREAEFAETDRINTLRPPNNWQTASWRRSIAALTAEELDHQAWSDLLDSA